MKNLIFPLLAISIGLSPSPVLSDNRNAIIITSSRVEEPEAEIGTAVTQLTQEDIEATGYSHIADLLRTTASIGVSNAGGRGKATALRIRGEEGYRTLLMIDGVDLSDPTGTQVGPQIQHLLLNNDVEKIEILRGAQGFIYGADAGGVVNIFTPKGSEIFRSHVRVEKGSFNTQRFNLNTAGGNNHVDFFVSSGYQSSDGFNARQDDTSGEKDGYDNTTLHGKFGYQPADNVRFQLVVRDISSENAFDRCFSGFTPVNDCIGLFDQTTNKVSLDYTTEHFSQHIAYALSDVDRENLAGGERNFSTDGEIARFEYWGRFSGENTRLVYGLDLEEEDIEPNAGEHLNRKQLGIYGEYKGSFANNTFITLGVRQDDNDDFGKYLSERATFAYLHQWGGDNSIKYRASYGTGFRAPSLSEIAYNDSDAAFGEAADTDLQEEITEGYDIGFDLNWHNGFIVQATYFDQKIEDEIFFDLANFSGYLQSTGDTRSRGLEVLTEVPLNQHWYARANYTYNDTKDREGQQRIRRPRHLANFGLQYSSGDQKLTALTNIRAAHDAEDEIFGVGRVELDDYVVVDVNLRYELTHKLSFSLNLQNLFDEDYEEITGFNVAERSVYLGAAVKL